VRRVHFLNVSAEEEDERGELFGWSGWTIWVRFGAAQLGWVFFKLFSVLFCNIFKTLFDSKRLDFFLNEVPMYSSSKIEHVALFSL
jgi:hypothetical protein